MGQKMSNETESDQSVVALAVQLLSAFVSNNRVSPEAFPALVRSTILALAEPGAIETVEDDRIPVARARKQRSAGKRWAAATPAAALDAKIAVQRGGDTEIPENAAVPNVMDNQPNWVSIPTLLGRKSKEGTPPDRDGVVTGIATKAEASAKRRRRENHEYPIED